MKEDSISLENLQEQINQLKTQVQTLSDDNAEDKLSMVVFSGDLDKLLAAFIIASGAAAMDMDVVMFFTFWATPALRDPDKKSGQKDLMGKMFGQMLPKGRDQLKLSKMNMGGMGTAMMKSLMKKKNVASLPQLIETAGELGVRLYICQMSMDLMGFTSDEMIDYPDLTYCGVAKFLEQASKSRIQLFL